MPAALALVAAGFACAAFITSLWQLYALLGVVLAAGIVMIEYVPNAAIVSRWVEGGRGLASAIAFTGMGTGALIIVPLAQILISARRWRAEFVVLGVGTFLLLTPVILIFQSRRPEEMG